MDKWKKTRLGSVGKVSMCKRVLKAQTSEVGDIPFFKISTFGGKAENYISDELYAEYKKKYSFPKKGDILISAAGTLGRTVVYDGTPSYFQDSNIVWLDNDESIILNTFLYYFYQTKPWQTTKGSTINRIYNEDLRSIQVRHPSIQYQDKIAKVLSTLDAKIELNNRINAELEALAKLLYDYWFVQFDFPMTAGQAAALGQPQLEGQPYKTSGGKMTYNTTLKREIPEGWEDTTVDCILAKEVRTKKIPNSEIQSSGSIPVVDQSKEFICGFTDELNSKIKDVPKIVFGDHTQVVKLINFPFARGADGTQILHSNTGCIPQHLFYQMLSNIKLSNYGYARHFKFLKQQKLTLPSEKIAGKFEQVAESIYQRIANNQKQNQELTALRDWLLPMLMNGQVTVDE